MKTLKYFLFSLILMGAMNTLSAQKTVDKAAGTKVNENIEIYYFHFSRRCATCNAVESETKNALKKYYSKQLEDGVIDFTSLNLDTKDSKKKANSLKLSGQSLLIVKGDQHINLTSQGFMNARTNPENFHKVLKEKIDGLL